MGLMANAVLLGRLLAVIDDFDRALDIGPGGHPRRAGWTASAWSSASSRRCSRPKGVKPIEAIGQPFDPNLHEAVVHEETTEHPDNTVIGEVQRGYLLRERVLRPSLVRVANNPGK